MEKRVIYAPSVDPKAAVFASAVVAGGVVYLSGQAGLVGGKVAGPDIETQTRQVMANLGEALKAAGSTWDKVVKVNCFLTDPPSQVAAWNKVFKEYFAVTPPARSTVGTNVLIGTDWLIEVDLIALA
jgi:2-iminobutanoate/2-iminopropanoate deaminase